jgi:hypothetical protein
MAGKQGALSDRPTQLPARYSPRCLWKLDRRCKTVREVAAQLVALWQDLGGFEALSTQQLMLCERTAFIHHKVIEFESAVMSGKPPPFDTGVYSNLANVLMGHLKTLGLERRQRPVKSLRAHLEAVP